MFPETLKSASRKTERPFQAQSVSHRTDYIVCIDQFGVEAYSPGVFPDVYFYPVPSQASAAARTAPNGVKERASFCLVFRSLNTTSSHRMFSMGYRRAKSAQGNTNFQKRIFLANHSGITTRVSLPACSPTPGNVQRSGQSSKIGALPVTPQTTARFRFSLQWGKCLTAFKVLVYCNT